MHYLAKVFFSDTIIGGCVASVNSLSRGYMLITVKAKSCTGSTDVSQ